MAALCESCPTEVAVTIGAVSVIAAAAALAGLVATLTRARHAGVAGLRYASLAVCALLLLASIAGRVSGWATGLAAAGAVVALQAIAMDLGRQRALRDYAAMRRRRRNGDPPWWPEFEREFRAHAPRPQHTPEDRDEA